MYEFISFVLISLNKSLFISSLAAVVWGVLSVLLSPCHLATVPIVVGYVSLKKGSNTGRFLISFIFSIGVLLSFILIGFITISLGRIFGDVGILNNLIPAFIFIVFGCYMLGIVKFDFSLTGGFTRRSSNIFWIGFVYGIGLGPCTFAYAAPILAFGYNISAQGILKPTLLIILFSVSHCLTLATAGYFGTKAEMIISKLNNPLLQKYLNRLIGIVLLILGLYYAIKIFI
ncbi:MAG: sulfite exporter TauE/SafE family protein [Calditerrivibrio sp.]|nr:sulfite exporter TauE/SafE family protein [Calditerrivibrio sp.]MCA1980957.1 sulfite exporter TauE/SafE family protein [Calditerrivibrio sp.]